MYVHLRVCVYIYMCMCVCVCVCVCELLNRVQLLLTPWTGARQVPLSMGFFRQAYWSRLPCLPPGDLPNSETEPTSPALQADSLLTEPPGKPMCIQVCILLFSCQVMSDFCNPMDCSTPGFPVPHHLLQFAQVHVY